MQLDIVNDLTSKNLILWISIFPNDVITFMFVAKET
jgi:hypothetical protein